jgi:hypothetical protein
MVVKAVNNTVGLDSLIPTLLVFGVYPKMVEYNPSLSIITQRAATLKRAITEVKKLYTKRQIQDVFNTCNSPSSITIYCLSLNSSVLVWREGKTGYIKK